MNVALPGDTFAVVVKAGRDLAAGDRIWNRRLGWCQLTDDNARLYRRWHDDNFLVLVVPITPPETAQ